MSWGRESEESKGKVVLTLIVHWTMLMSSTELVPTLEEDNLASKLARKRSSVSDFRLNLSIFLKRCLTTAAELSKRKGGQR